MGGYETDEGVLPETIHGECKRCADGDILEPLRHGLQRPQDS